MMPQAQEISAGEARYYAYEVSRPAKSAGLQKSVHSFPDAMSMDEWVNSGSRKTIKRKENRSDIKRYPLGLAHSDKVALYQVFDANIETKSVIRHSSASTAAPHPENTGRATQKENPWVNVKIPKVTDDGAPALRVAKDANGNGVYAIELPGGLPPAPVLPFRTRRTEAEPVDISHGTVFVSKRAKRPVEERGAKGWRAGVIKCISDSDCYEVGFRKEASNGDPWRVVVQLDGDQGSAPRKVAIASEDFASCLHSHRSTTRETPRTALYRYPHPSQFQQQPMVSPDEVKYLWQDTQHIGGKIEISHRILDRVWLAKGILPENDACPIERISTAPSFEEAYCSDFEYLAAHMHDVVIANPADPSKPYRNAEHLKAELGQLRPTHSYAAATDEPLPSSTPTRAKPMAVQEGVRKPAAR